MPHRALRTMLVLICLLGLAGCGSGAEATRASTSAMRTPTPGIAHTRPIFQHAFQPSGHGTELPQTNYTAMQSHIDGAAFASMSLPSEASTQISEPASHSLLTSQNVVNVPPAGSTDPTARQGLFQLGGKSDANGAGGLNNYLETTYPGVAIFSRNGTPLLRSTYRNWFGVNDSFYDPIVTWDDTGQRFIFSALQLAGEYIWLSVAQQSDAIGAYCNYSFPAPYGHDFDKLGVDGDGIYFSFNMLAPGTENVVSNELFSVSRTAIERCQAAVYTYWIGLTNPDGTIAEAITPARQDSSAGGVEYLVNSYPAGACRLTLWALTSSDTLSNTSIPTQCYSPPPSAMQKGTSILINTGDCSLTQASYVNGLLTVDTQSAYDWGDGNGKVSIVEWFVLNPITASVARQGAFGTPGYWLFYPSAIMTPNGHMLFLYSASGSSIYPSAWYVNQTLVGTTALADGTTYYIWREAASPWGDYQSAWPDAGGGLPNSVWITGEFAKATHVWGTRFDLVTP